MKIREQFFAMKQIISELVLACWIIRPGENNIFDFPSLFFYVDDQWNTQEKVTKVSCVYCGGNGGGGGKTMEMW